MTFIHSMSHQFIYFGNWHYTLLWSSWVSFISLCSQPLYLQFPLDFLIILLFWSFLSLTLTNRATGFQHEMLSWVEIFFNTEILVRLEESVGKMAATEEERQPINNQNHVPILAPWELLSLVLALMPLMRTDNDTGVGAGCIFWSLPLLPWR